MTILFKSIDIADFKLSISNFVNASALPTELKRLVLKEIHDEVALKAKNEMIAQAEEREKTKHE